MHHLLDGGRQDRNFKLLFDIEIAFLYPFAMALRELRWAGFIQLVLFFLIMLAGYIYVWRKGVFNWGHER